MSSSISIPPDFNGPLESGNGGYVSGLVAGRIDGPAEVSLRSPAPLETPLRVVGGQDGSVEVLAGETLVATGRPSAEVDLELPPPVSVDDARRASAHYRGSDEGPFSRCFVCSRVRTDSFGVFAGAVEGRDVVATPWKPAESTDDGAGNVRSELVWAVLDCPTYFALYPDSNPLSFLARFSVRIDAPVPVDREHVVVAWPIEKDGRKHSAGSAVLSAEGKALAVAKALLIEARAG